MVRSMTGYGRAEAILDGQKYTVEVKSLNHRFLEISLRLPASLSALEMGASAGMSRAAPIMANIWH
jgi:uncharacterized protein (TIGR00255 family)